MDNPRERATRVVKVLDKMVPFAFQNIHDIMKKSPYSDREVSIALWYWIKGRIPLYLIKQAKEMRYLGKIASDFFTQEKPTAVTTQEERNALKLLASVCKWVYEVWGSQVFAKVWVAAGRVEMSAIRIEIAQLSMGVKYGYEYISLLRVLFD